MPPIPPGSRFGPYVVEAPIGEGGMGVVSLARHVETGGRCALKVMLHQRLGPREGQALARFRREVDVLAQIEPHPAIASIYACGSEDGIPWCAMELIEGQSVQALIDARRGLPAKEAARIVAATARGVEHVHRHGVLHRDLKPANVLVCGSTGRARLIDFGLAYDLFAERLTRTGQIVGTPAFMAPEQVSGRRATDDDATTSAMGKATDVYGLGAILYACLTGRPPFSGERDVVALLTRLVRQPPEAPRRIVPDVPVELEAICLRCLEKQPADRYPTAEAVASDIERWERGEAPTTRPVAGWRRALRGPRGRRVAAIGACVAMSAILLTVAAFAWVSRRGPRARALVAELERSLEERGWLTDEQRGRLEQLDLPSVADLGGEVPAQELQRRVELVEGLVAVAEADGDAEVERALARLVRPGGEVDRPLLLRAERSLAAADRWGALLAVLDAEAPAVPVEPELAGRLARAILDDADGRLLPPAERAAFRALLRAPGLTDEERGELLVRHGARHRERGPEGFEEALGALVDARIDHGALPEAGLFDQAFADHAYGALIPLLESEPDRGRALFEIVTIGADAIPPPSPALLGQLHREVIVTDVPGPARVRRLILIASLLERLGMWMRDPAQAQELTGQLQLDFDLVLKLGDEELARPTGRRSAALLAFLANFLVTMEGHRERSNDYLEAALRTGAEGAWVSFAVGMHRQRSRRFDEALVAYERAMELETEEHGGPLMPVLPERLARMLIHSSEGSNPASVARAARLTVMSGRLMLSLDERIGRIFDAAGVMPWRFVRSVSILTLIPDICDRLLAIGPPACCEAGGVGAVAPSVVPGTDDTPGVEQLVALGIEILKHPRWSARNAFVVAATSEGNLIGWRGLHHESHGRHAEALADVTRAIDDERTRTPIEIEAARTRWKSLAKWRRDRARIHRALGHRRKAAADERAAERAEKRALPE